MDRLMTASLKVTVLGSSGTYASTDNPCTGLLLRSVGANVLLDCGPGTLGPLQREIDPARLTAVVLSHCHPDHWLELPVLRNVFKYFRPVERIDVFGTERTRQMDQALAADPPRVDDPIVWHVIDEKSTLRIGDQDWTFSRTDHPVETLAARVEVGDSKFAFSSDTGPAWGLDHLGPGIDLAICEASHLSAAEARGIPHISARQAGQSAREAGVERLVITHILPGSDVQAHIDEAEQAFHGKVAFAEPGTTFEI